MARRKKIIENLLITDIVPDGKGLGRKNDLVVFVKDVIPGDVVDALVVKSKTSFKEAKPVKFHKYSNLRIKPVCKHFGLCGGCKWQNIKYEQQLKYKQKIVTDAFERIAKTKIGQISKILPSKEVFYYRNKLEYTFSKHRWLTKDEINSEKRFDTNGLGFHVPGMYDRIVDIDECFLQSKFSDEIRNSVGKFAKENNLDFFDIRNNSGFLRNLIVRNSRWSNEYMVIVIFGNNDMKKRNLLLNFISENFHQITSLYYIINEKKNDNYADLKPVLFSGNEFISEKMGDLKFRIGPKSFFQTNTSQAKKLYDITMNFADLKGSEIVYDLYTGTGTLALYASHKAKKVVGIEIIEEAITDAKKNAEINRIKNAKFVAGDIKLLLKDDFILHNGKPDVVILDPPRAGIHKDVLKVLKNSQPNKIVYISCNPASQARDVGMLSDKYKVVKIQPVDMFPHTYHIENVALLTI